MLDAKNDLQNKNLGRPKANFNGPTAKERILIAASELFCRYGINAIGVDAIINKAGTAKTTLYKIFGSKEVLVKEVLIREGLQWRQRLFNALDALEKPADYKLLAIFDELEKWFSEEQYYGCPFINAVGEHDKLDDLIRTITLDHKKQVLQKIETLLNESGVQDAESVGHEFAVLIDGAIVASLITKDPQVAQTAKRTAQAIMSRELNKRKTK